MAKRPEKLTIDQDFKGALEELRFKVENPNKMPHIFLAGDVYRQRNIRKVETLIYGNWEIGYQVLEMPDMVGTYIRNIYFKLRNGLFSELPKREFEESFLVIIEVFIDQGQMIPIYQEIAPDCMIVSQIFMPMFLKEMNPNLKIPGGKGHV